MISIGSIYTLYGKRGGAELLSENIYRELPCNFPDINFTIFCNKEAFITLPESDNYNKIYIRLLDSQYGKFFWLFFLAKKYINSFGFQYFFIPSGTNSFPGSWSSKNIIQFLDFGELHINGKYDFIRSFYRKYICIPLSIRRGDIFVSISKFTQNDLFNYYSKTSLLAYPGVSARRKTTAPFNARELIQKETGITLDRIIFTPGRTDFIGKGLDVLIESYYFLKNNSINPPPLVLVGSKGIAHGLLIDKINEFGLQESIYWLGRVSDECVDSLYSISDFVVISSRFEGFGFPVLEAMERGVPVISTDAGSLAELVTAGSGIIVPAGDAAALGKAMLFLNENRELSNRLRSNGLKRAEDFRWDGYYRIYNQIFNSN